MVRALCGEVRAELDRLDCAVQVARVLVTGRSVPVRCCLAVAVELEAVSVQLAALAVRLREVPFDGPYEVRRIVGES